MRISQSIFLLTLLVFIVQDGVSISDIKQLECQFTDGLCGYSIDNGTWTLGDYNDVSFGRPTEPSLGGGYVFVNGDNLNHFHQLSSPIIDEDVEPFCLTFGYYMFGSNVGQLSLRLVQIDASVSWVEVDDDAWKRKGSQQDDWSIGRYHFNMKRKDKVRIGFIATTPDIAIGPIKVTPGSCEYNGLCDFEDLSSCFWTIEPDSKSNFIWYTSNGKSGGNLLPQTDTTTQTESGKYLRTPSDGQKDSKSVLVTKFKINSDNAKCLTFNLFKPDQNSDLVEVSVVKGNQLDPELIWSSSSIKADSKWLPVQVNINESDYFNLLVTSHKHSKDGETSVAIDDLQLDPNSCNHKIDCSFDDTNCRLIVSSGPLLVGFGRLSNGQALNYSMDTFKNEDPDDFFMYTDTPNDGKPIKYQFSSQLIPKTEVACLSFNYFIDSTESNGIANFLFEIKVSTSSGSTEKFEPAVIFGQWSQVEYLITDPYQIQFNLDAETNLFAGFDDIQLIDGVCGVQSTPEQSKGDIYLRESFTDRNNWPLWKTWEMKKYCDSKAGNERGYPLADPFSETTGNYIAVYNDKTDYDKQARIRSRSFDKGSHCLSIWFWCSLSHTHNRLFISLIDLNTNKSTPILDKSCDNPHHWKFLEASYHTESDYSIEIIGQTQSGLVALEEVTIYNGPCYQDHAIDETCTFDDGSDCGIDLVTSPIYNWRVEQGLDISTPVADKSTSTFNGRSLVLDVNPPSKIDSTSYFYLANLRDEDNYCVSFAYFIKGKCDLSIWKTKRKEIDALTNPLVTYDGSFGPTWFTVLLQIDRVQKETDIVFGGSYSSQSSGLIAIDDLKVSRGKCISSGDCNFDNVCKWTNLAEGAILNVDSLDIGYEVTSTFLRGSAAIAKDLGYPRKDHTFAGSEYNYGCTLNSYDRRAIYASPLIYLNTQDTSICLTLAYAVDEGSIEILVEQQEGKAYVYKNLHSDSLRTWSEATLTIQLRPSPTRMARVYIVSSPKGLAAVDDLSLRPGPCPVQDQVFTCSDGSKIHNYFKCDFKNDCPNGEDELNCGSCEFTSSACDYEGSGTEAVWKVRNGAIELKQDGMSFSSKTTAVVVSPMIQETSSTCQIELRYTKNSSDSFVISLTSKDSVQLWDSSIIQTETSGWNNVTIELGRIRNPFQLTFSVKTTYRVFEYQFFSIDYVHFIDCDFKSTDQTENVFTCADGQRILTDQLCDSSFDCRSGEDEDNCNNQVYSFENGLLTPWYFHENVVIKQSPSWTVTSGNGIISDMPTLDHSRRSPIGQYVLLAWSTAYNNLIESNKLFGPKLNSTKNCLMTFYYFLSSPSLTINVYLYSSGNHRFLQNVDQLSDNGFKQATISLKSEKISSPLKVVFTGFVDGSSLAYAFIALDDITFSPGCFGLEPIQPSPKPRPKPTPEPEPKGFCQGDEFHCTVDDKCIPIDATCNYMNDCSDGEDEKYCGSCNFGPDGLCGWINEGSNEWIPMDRSTARQEGFPNIIDSPENFLVATSSSDKGSAAIRSPLLGATSPLCLFKFKYHLSGDSKLTVRMQQENAITSKVIEELDHHNSSTESPQWIQGQIELHSLTFDHYLQFVLDPPSSDTFLVSSGLSDFKMIYCDPSKVNFDSFSCPFDDNSCGWIDTGSNGLSWSLTTNSSHLDEHKFGFGSLSNQYHPTFINLNIGPDHKINSVRTLTSPWIYAIDTFCFNFDYRLLAFDETKFMLIIETPGSILRTLFWKNGEPSYGWNGASVTIKDVDEFRLIFRIELGPNSADTVVSIDNLRLSNGQCGVHQASCDFTTGSCDWINKGWSFVDKQQVPSSDNQNREHYLRNYGNRTASLTLKGDGNEVTDKCLSFWYFHTFNVTSDLQINALEGDLSVSTEVVPDHEMANVWSYHQANVMIGDDYGVTIVAGPLGSFDTTAIDDVTIHNRSCDTPGNCDFEYDSCGWRSPTIIKWRRNYGVTPSTDNSIGERLKFDERGWFIFVRAIDLNSTREAQLESIKLLLTSPVCMSFNYLFTSGQSSDSKITIKMLDTHTDSITEVYVLSDDGLIEWKTIEVTVRCPNPFKVLLGAFSGANESSDIALDDIRFTSGKCSGDIDPTTIKPTTTPTTPLTTPIETTTPEIETSTIFEPTTTPISSKTNPASVLTANAFMYMMRQNSHIIVGTGVLIVMLLFPMVFVARRMMKPVKSYATNESISFNNRVYDINLGTVKDTSTNSIYDEVDSSSINQLTFI